MIIDKLSNSGLYKSISPGIKSALEFLESADIKSYPAGRHDLDGDNLFVLINHYETKSAESSKPEGHRKYIDVQYLAAGTEMIGVSPFQCQPFHQEYDEEKDYALFNAGLDYITIRQGMFAIFFPEDIHQPGIFINEPERVIKAVVKVRV